MAHKAHFIGIAGKGMSATALLLQQSGWRITGSDEGFYPPVSDYLIKAGITFAAGYRKENIPDDADLIIIGKNTKLVAEENEEVAAALASGKDVQSFPDVLHGLTQATNNIVVAGSYGKSTTTALLSWCLAHAGKDPSYFIGEITKGFAGHAHLGRGGVFVLEGDEYPSANWDPTSKFLHYNARSILLTSATHDHINVFPTHESYLEPFRKLITSLPEDGLIVVGPEAHARTLAINARVRVVCYSLSEREEWHAEAIRYGAQTTFDLMHGSEGVATIRTTLLGVHNIENIVGAGALLLERNLLTPDELEAGVASFQGVKRRMESLAPDSSVPVFEGFGSSYEKAKSAIAAMKLHFPTRRLLVIFEPHTFTWRNRSAITQYDDVFAGADKIFIYEPAKQGASTHAQATQAEIVGRVREAGFDAAQLHGDASELVHLADEIDGNDAVLLLTSGDLGGLIVSLPKMLEARFPAGEK